MRVLTALVALAALPFAAGMAQGSNPFSDPKNCGAHLNFSDKAAAHRADAALPHGGKHGVMDRPCSSPVVEPPATTCAVTAQPNEGPWSIEGKVMDGLTGANWCIHLTGPVSRTLLTDATGRYKFAGLPEGDYVVCEDVDLTVWGQTYPTLEWAGVPCPTGIGHGFWLAGFASFNDFWNVKL